MIHAYNDFYLPIVQELMGNMIEIAVCIKKIPINEFMEKLLNSKYIEGIESGDPVIVCGKSPNELLGLLLDTDPINVYQDVFATPEYWCGYVLAYAGWYFNVSYKTILKYYDIENLLLDYFPFHEMDIRQIMDKIKECLPIKNKLKEYRQKNGLSQGMLAIMADVPIRTIKAYEQETLEISKASGETLYALAKVLKCSIEDLIL